MAVAGDSTIYISCLDRNTHETIHRFDEDGRLLNSFCESFAAGKDVDIRLEGYCAGGSLAIAGNGEVLYSQTTPYEIRRFSAGGELLTVVERENSFMLPPIFEVDGGIQRIGLPTGCYSIVALATGGFLNVALAGVQAEEYVRHTIIDIYGDKGSLRASRRFESVMIVRCRGPKGRLFVDATDDVPRVVRCRLVLTR